MFNVEKMTELRKKSITVTGNLSPIAFNNEIFIGCSSLFYKDIKDLYKRIDIKFNKGDKLIDVGCNNGIKSFLLSELFPELEIFGCDINKYAIEEANYIKESYLKINKVFNVKFEQNNMSNIDYSKFNYILNSNIDISFESVKSKIDIYKRNHFSGKIIIELADNDDGFIISTKETMEKILDNYYSHVITVNNKINKELVIIDRC